MSAGDLRRRMAHQTRTLKKVIRDALPGEFALGGIMISMNETNQPVTRLAILQTRSHEGRELTSPDVAHISLTLGDSVSMEVTGGKRRVSRVAQYIGDNYMTAIMSLTILAVQVEMTE